jgi:integrase/recombinase XerD
MWMYELARQPFKEGNTMTDKEIVHNYLEDVKNSCLSAVTKKRRKFILVYFMDFMQKSEIERFSQVTSSHIDAFVCQLQKDKSKTGKEVYMSGTANFFSWLFEKKLISADPVEMYRYPFSECDYPDQLKKYYDLYLKENNDKGVQFIKIEKRALRVFFEYLVIGGIKTVSDLKVHDLNDYYFYLQKRFKARQTLLYNRCYVKKWLNWLGEKKILDKDLPPVPKRQPSEAELNYLDFLEKEGYSELYIDYIKHVLSKSMHFFEKSGNFLISEVSRDDVKKYKEYMRNKGIYSDKTQKRHLNIFKRFLYYCKMTGRIKTDSFSSLKENKTADQKRAKGKGLKKIAERIPEKYQGLYKDYLNYLQARGHRKRGISNLKRIIPVIIEYMENRGLNDFHAFSVKEALNYQKWSLERTKKSTKGTGTKEEARRRIAQTNTFFNYLKVKKLVYSNPFLDIKKLRSERTIPRGILKENEMKKLLASLCNYDHEKGLRNQGTSFRIHVIAELMYSTGLRIAEVSQLKIDDIDFVRGIVNVKEGKGGFDRIAFLNEYASKVLELYIKEIRPLILTSHHNKDLLFGAGYDCLGTIVNRVLRNRCKDLAIPVITSHSFRHSLGTHLLRSGCDIRYIQAILGHKRISSTEIYTKVDKEDLKGALDKYHPRQFKKGENKNESEF